jgi:dimethylglycine dehydrogenase
VGFHVTGNLRLATCRDRMDEYLKYCGTANTIGVPFRIITPDEVKALWPLVDLGDGVNTPKIVGALYHPDDGHIAPVDLTWRCARGGAGAEIRADRGTGAPGPPGRMEVRRTRATSRASTSCTGN